MSDFIPYGRQSIDDSDVDAVVDALRSDWLTQGPRIEQFERALADYCGSRYAVAVSSGTAALHIAYLAAGLGTDDEVVTTPMTFMATSNAALYCGARPVFADVELDTGNLDADSLSAAVTSATRAVTAVHLNGLSCDMQRVSGVARDAGAVTIEDASHALGGTYRGSRVGCCEYSDMTTLSFHPVKLITTGEGGAVLTNDESLFERLVALREHGIVRDSEKHVGHGPDRGAPWYHEMQELGFNYRMTDLQAALGSSQLARLDGFVRARTEIADRYDSLLGDVSGVRTPGRREYARSAWHLYPVRVDAAVRRTVFQTMRDSGIGVQVHYMPVYSQPYYQRVLGDLGGSCPRAEEYYEEVLSLPVFPGLAEAEQDRVVDVLLGAL